MTKIRTKPSLQRLAAWDPLRSIAAPLLLMGIVGATPAFAQEGLFSLRPLELLRNPLLGRADLAGFVFEDTDGDGLKGTSEAGLPGVSVVTEGGRSARTDGAGRFQLSELRPGQHAIWVTPGSLPAGGSLVAERAVLELPPGSVRRVDFPVHLAWEAIHLGQAAERAPTLQVRLSELPVNFVGNTTDLQALFNGVRVPFPQAKLDLIGFLRGGYLDGGRLSKARIGLSVSSPLTTRHWKLELSDGTGTVLFKRSARGKPPRKIALSKLIDAGSHLPAPGAYSLRLCASFGPGLETCSPYRLFGLTSGRGRRTVRPALTHPPGKAVALINDRPATLDADGSFILPISLKDPSVHIRLQRPDGRSTAAILNAPRLTLQAPTAQTRIQWGEKGDAWSAPTAPGPVQVLLSFQGLNTNILSLSKTPHPFANERLKLPLEVHQGDQRLELSAQSKDGLLMLYELSLRLADTAKDGTPILSQARIPELELFLPAEGALLHTQGLVISGKAEPGAKLLANGHTIPLQPDGRFRAALQLEQGGVAIEIVGGDGSRGEISRQWRSQATRRGGSVYGQIDPFLKLLFSSDPALPVQIRKGSGGQLQLEGRLRTVGGTRLWGGAGFESLSRPLDAGAAGARSWGLATARLGAQGRLGSKLTLLANYEGLSSIDSLSSLRHESQLRGSLRFSKRAFDLQADLVSQYDLGPTSGQRLMLGGALAARLRAGPQFDFRAGVEATQTLLGSQGGVLEGLIQGSYLLPAQALLSLRLSHIADTRDVAPEATGNLAHLSLWLPLGRRLHLSQTLGVWLVSGGLTLSEAFRIELLPYSKLLFALDYRLQTQFDVHEHQGLAEITYRVAPWVRVSAVYSYVAVTGGIEHSSRFQTRVELTF